MLWKDLQALLINKLLLQELSGEEILLNSILRNSEKVQSFVNSGEISPFDFWMPTNTSESLFSKLYMDVGSNPTSSILNIAFVAEWLMATGS